MAAETILRFRKASIFLAATLSLPSPSLAQTFSPPSRVQRHPAPQAMAPITPASSAGKPSRAIGWGPLFAGQVQRCWKKERTPPKASLTAIFSVKLSTAGMITDVHAISVSPDTEAGRSYQAGGLRALQDCQPYSLPGEYYGEWRHFEPVFSTR